MTLSLGDLSVGLAQGCHSLTARYQYLTELGNKNTRRGQSLESGAQILGMGEEDTHDTYIYTNHDTL